MPPRLGGLSRYARGRFPQLFSWKGAAAVALLVGIGASAATALLRLAFSSERPNMILVDYADGSKPTYTSARFQYNPDEGGALSVGYFHGRFYPHADARWTLNPPLTGPSDLLYIIVDSTNLHTNADSGLARVLVNGEPIALIRLDYLAAIRPRTVTPPPAWYALHQSSAEVNGALASGPAFLVPRNLVVSRPLVVEVRLDGFSGWDIRGIGIGWRLR